MIEIRVVNHFEKPVVKLMGELVGEAAAAFKTEIMEKTERVGRRVLVDMWDVDFVDSGGLGAFIEVSGSLVKRGQYLQLSRIDPRIKRIFTSIHVEEAFRKAREDSSIPMHAS